MGSAPVSWGVLEIEGWSTNPPFGKVLDEIVQAGYSGTELGPYGFLPTDAQALAQELRSRNLALAGAFVPLALFRPEAHEAGLQEAIKTADLLAAAGAPVIVLADEMSERRMAVAGRVDPERDGQSAAAWETAAKLVTRAAREAKQRGLRAVFHHHAATYVETPEEIDRLLSLIDANLLGLCLDTGHYYYGGGDPGAFAERQGARIWHVHWKDVNAAVLEAARRNRTGYLDAVRQGVFCELGQGAIDFTRVIRALEHAGYEGWGIFEQDVDPAQPGFNPPASAARSREYLRTVAGV
jgi:inosose dehydratase